MADRARQGGRIHRRPGRLAARGAHPHVAPAARHSAHRPAIARRQGRRPGRRPRAARLDRGGDDHRPRQRRERGRGAAPGRHRLHGEAGRRRAPEGDPAPRAAHRRAARRDRRAARRAAQARPLRPHPRLLGADAEALRPARPRGADLGHGAHHRRERHRQGARRADPPRPEPAKEVAVPAAQLRRGVAAADRERAVRPREGLASPAPTASTRATSSARTAARCSSTRSPRCRRSCR